MRGAPAFPTALPVNTLLFAALLMVAPLGGPNFENWSNLKPAANGEAAWNTAEDAVFRYPKGPLGWHRHGFRGENDSAADWRGFYGLRFEALIPEGRTLELQATIAPPGEKSRAEYVRQSRAKVAVSGGGWRQVTLPWTLFDYEKGRAGFLQFIRELRLSGKFADGKGGEVTLKNVRLIAAPEVALEADVRGKAVRPGGTATYEVTVGNCTEATQEVALTFEHYGWESMAASVEPANMTLAPGATVRCVVSVRLPTGGIPPGGHERQQLLATGNGGSALGKLEFITARDAARPSILHTPEEWNDVRDKVKKYDWAKRAQDDYVKAADAWNVPQAATPAQRARGPEGHPYVFLNPDFEMLPKAAIAWQLTRKAEYAQKAALFLRRLADEQTGYPSVFAGTSMGEPQEGGNFQGVAIAYDAILDAGVLSDADRTAIERMFRLYMETVEPALQVGNVGNWNVAGDTGALFCALALGDLAAAERYLYGPSGYEDYVTKGVMDDGWWWEGSTSYNFWVASELTQCGLACRPWGIDLIHRAFPANFSPHTVLTPWALDPPLGMSFDKWGPSRRNTRSVKQLWDAVPGVADYRGIAFGMNDGHEEAVGGSRLELGYFAYRDPAYVPLIKQAGKRDLVYGVPDLPETDAKPYLQSSLAENLGFALLRSQTPDRPPRERIEAVFKIGAQGGYHGHFDRVSLNTIMRYGRSFWSPESVWWGYANFMYKFYVQNSVAHNMVVVDQKQQEAVPSAQSLFFSGKKIQVSAQETNARWSDPPYGGMQYTASSSGGAVDTLAALMRKNRQSFPLVTDRKWGDLGPFGDRVLQRRVGIVTDDYIVVADYLKSGQPHTFDNLFQMKGFRGLDAADKKSLRHDAQFNPDPHTSAQFITDCEWYQASAPAVGRFEMEFGPEDARNEPGVLKIDIHSVWPKRQEILLATPPEPNGGAQWVSYEVSAGGRTLAKGESGVWILGAADIDAPVEKSGELTLSVRTDSGKKSALFLANARLVTADGKETPVTGATEENVAQPPKPGQDYEGGPIKIAGTPYASALPVQPADSKKPAVIRIPLGGKGAVRFKATLGGDYPLGDESRRRKIYGIRAQGIEARFLTVLEPYENKPMVKFAEASGPDSLRVNLADGRVQEIAIKNLAGSGKEIAVEITEIANGQVTHEESGK